MSALSVVDVKCANRPGAVSAGRKAKTASIQSVIINCIKRLHRAKPWAALMDILGVDEHVAKHRINGTRKFSADDVAGLLQTDDGYRYLAAIMAQAKRPPTWWRICAPLMELADVQKMQLQARRRYERALKATSDADQSLTAALQQGQAALMFQDEGFYGPQFAPYGELDRQFDPADRLPDRAMAPAAQKGGRR